jgi:hypothetical protein
VIPEAPGEFGQPGRQRDTYPGRRGRGRGGRRRDTAPALHPAGVQRQSGAYELGERAGAPASRRVKAGTAARLSLSWLECLKSVSWYVEQLYSSLTMIVSGQKYSEFMATL